MFCKIKKYLNVYNELRYLAYHDALTGLYNRHYLNTINRDKYKYVYFIDLNDLKSYNTHGHTVGDKHIIHCVNFIKTNYVTKTDCFIRYAGDEFILLTSKIKNISDNKLYTVGESQIFASINYSIELADKRMILNKMKNKNSNI